MNAPVNSPSTAPPAAPPQDPEAEKLERVEFYAASVAAWYATALEFDKTMITLSAAAIGLLGALATTGVTSLERWETYAFSAATRGHKPRTFPSRGAGTSKLGVSVPNV